MELAEFLKEEGKPLTFVDS